MRKAFVIVVALALLPGWAAGEQLAKVGKKTIDRADVEKAVKSQLVAIERERYDAIKGGLDELVAQALFEQEATARGVTVEQLQQVEIVEKVPQPTDAEIQKVY